MQREIIPFAIIGAGPAGLMAAFAYGEGATVFERNSFAGKKLLLSGSGQCNICNSLENEEFLSRCGKAANFLKPALYTLQNRDIFEIFERFECPLFTRDDGKVFPRSLRSADVRNAMLKMLASKGTEILYDHYVQSIDFQQGLYKIISNHGEYLAKQILLAPGGKSYPESGSDGSVYGIAEKLGHEISPLHPALTAIKIQDFSDFSSCAGIVMRPFGMRSSRISKLPIGDVLITHTGLSGPGILENSENLKPGDTLFLKLVQNADVGLIQLCKDYPTKEFHTLLKSFGLADSLATQILRKNSLDPYQKAATITREQRLRVSGILEALPFIVSSLEGWDKAMATAGGIKLLQINSHTMESRIHQGLYFAGEVLDYSVPTGGYNIRLALCTGYLAGSAAQKTNTQKG